MAISRHSRAGSYSDRRIFLKNLKNMFLPSTSEARPPLFWHPARPVLVGSSDEPYKAVCLSSPFFSHSPTSFFIALKSFFVYAELVCTHRVSLAPRFRFVIVKKHNTRPICATCAVSSPYCPSEYLLPPIPSDNDLTIHLHSSEFLVPETSVLKQFTRLKFDGKAENSTATETQKWQM